MNDSLNSFLTQDSRLFVKQTKEWVEILINWETTNRYAIFDETQNKIGHIAERGGDFQAKLKRWLLRSHRPLEVDVFDGGGLKIHLSRNFFFFFSSLKVSLPGGENVGRIHRRFGIFYKRYDLRDRHGQVFGRIKSPIWRPWTFSVVDRTDQERAVISKKWQGILKEAFSDADGYLIDFKGHPWTNEQRWILLSAAISIDFDFFEDNQQ